MNSSQQRIVIVGAGGRLGAALMREYGRADQVVGLGRPQIDLTQTDSLRKALEPLEFDLLINCAAQTNVDRCEVETAEAFAINAEAPRVLAKVCVEKGARLLHISTDYVFDGAQSTPYTEEDAAEPISVYGQSKREGEKLVLAVDPGNLVVRVSWVFGPDRPSFIDWVIQQAREKDTVAAVADKFSTPTYTCDLAGMLRACWSQDAPESDEFPGGLLHLTNQGSCSWQEYGQWALNCCREEGMALCAEKVDAISLAEMKQFVARRPLNTVLSTKKFERLTGQLPRPWQEAVRAYVRDFVASV